MIHSQIMVPSCFLIPFAPLVLSQAVIHSLSMVLSSTLIHSELMVPSCLLIHSELLVPSRPLIKTGPPFYAHAQREQKHKVRGQPCHDDVRTMLRAGG